MVLREEALTRIQELTSASCDRDAREAERSESVMADDGGPIENNPGDYPTLLLTS